MGYWKIEIYGLGPHHNLSQNLFREFDGDADLIAKQFVNYLSGTKYHRVDKAYFTVLNSAENDDGKREVIYTENPIKDGFTEQRIENENYYTQQQIRITELFLENEMIKRNIETSQQLAEENKKLREALDEIAKADDSNLIEQPHTMANIAINALKGADTCAP